MLMDFKKAIPLISASILGVFLEGCGGSSGGGGAPEGPRSDSAPEVTLSVCDRLIVENIGSANITASLNNATSEDVIITLSATGTAIENDDYQWENYIEIPSGATSGSTFVTSIEDSVKEDDETLVVGIESLTNAVVSTTQQVTLIIANTQNTQDESFPDVQWQESFVNGTEDVNGIKRTGTEVRSFAVMDGKLFAGLGIWMDPGDASPEQPGPQILVLERSEAEGGVWQVDYESDVRIENTGTSFDGKHLDIVISTMRTITFNYDENGDALDEPVSFLLAGVWRRQMGVYVLTRDVSGSWETTTLGAEGDNACYSHVRSFLQHHDAETGVDLVFAGTSGAPECPTQIYQGAYDSAENKIVWNPQPNTWVNGPDTHDRVTSMATANNKAYASACGKVFERIDGIEPEWVRIFRHPDDRCEEGPGENGYRGLTTIGSAEEGQSLLIAMEGWQAYAGVLDLLPTPTWQNEIHLNPHLQDWTGFHVGYSITAYDGMLRFPLPSGNTVTLMGVETSAYHNPDAWNGWAPEARYFVRHDDGRYERRTLIDETLPPGIPLVAIRTMIASPFDADNGRVIYAGGFDSNFTEADDTAWLYRGSLQGLE